NLWEQFADAESGRARGDGGERPAEFERGAGLGVPGVEVRRAAPQPQEHDRLRRAVGRAALGAEPEQVGQRQAEDAAGTAHAESAARPRLAGTLPLPADEQHRTNPPTGTGLNGPDYTRARQHEEEFILPSRAA